MTEPVDDWTAEYGENGPNQAWFEDYIAGVEQAGEETPVNKPIDDAWTFFRELQQHGSATVTNRLRDELEEVYGPPGWLRDSFDRWLKTFETHDEPPPALRAAGTPARDLQACSKLLQPLEIDSGRVTRELAPLVRRAAAEVPQPTDRVDAFGGHLRASRTPDEATSKHWADQRWTDFCVRWGYPEYLPVSAGEHHYDCGCPDHSWWLP